MKKIFIILLAIALFGHTQAQNNRNLDNPNLTNRPHLRNEQNLANDYNLANISSVGFYKSSDSIKGITVGVTLTPNGRRVLESKGVISCNIHANFVGAGTHLKTTSQHVYLTKQGNSNGCSFEFKTAQSEELLKSMSLNKDDFRATCY